MTLQHWHGRLHELYPQSANAVGPASNIRLKNRLISPRRRWPRYTHDSFARCDLHGPAKRRRQRRLQRPFLEYSAWYVLSKRFESFEMYIRRHTSKHLCSRQTSTGYGAAINPETSNHREPQKTNRNESTARANRANHTGSLPAVKKALRPFRAGAGLMATIGELCEVFPLLICSGLKNRAFLRSRRRSVKP